MVPFDDVIMYNFLNPCRSEFVIENINKINSTLKYNTYMYTGLHVYRKLNYTPGFICYPHTWTMTMLLEDYIFTCMLLNGSLKAYVK